MRSGDKICEGRERPKGHKLSATRRKGKGHEGRVQPVVRTKSAMGERIPEGRAKVPQGGAKDVMGECVP